MKDAVLVTFFTIGGVSQNFDVSSNFAKKKKLHPKKSVPNF